MSRSVANSHSLILPTWDTNVRMCVTRVLVFDELCKKYVVYEGITGLTPTLETLNGIMFEGRKMKFSEAVNYFDLQEKDYIR